jgi:hypothetical protein
MYKYWTLWPHNHPKLEFLQLLKIKKKIEGPQNHKVILAPKATFKRFFKPLYLVRIISGRGRTNHERLFAPRSSFKDWFVLPVRVLKTKEMVETKIYYGREVGASKL